MIQTDSHCFPTSIPAQRSTAAQIMATSFLSRRMVDVYRNMFFQGSTAPFGDTSRQLGQFRSRAQLRTITQISRLLPLRIAYTTGSAAPALIFIRWGAHDPWASQFVWHPRFCTVFEVFPGVRRMRKIEETNSQDLRSEYTAGEEGLWAFSVPIH